MARYRYVQFSDYKEGTIKAGINLGPQGYHNVKRPLLLKGWVLTEQGKVESINVDLYAKTKRSYLTIDTFEESPDLAKKFPKLEGANRGRFSLPLNASQLPELKDKQDFALEFSAVIGGKSHTFKTISFLKDSYRGKAIFVVGSPRSGTSILGNTLSHVLLNTRNFNEGHMLGLLPHLNQRLEAYYKGTAASFLKGMMLSETNSHLLFCQLQNVFKVHYENIYQSGWIVDKTPGGLMLNALPSVKQMWPQAHIIFAKRRGIENIVSRLRKFPERSFEDHCRQWTDAMMRWHRLKADFSKTLEIDQFDIETSPNTVVNQLGRVLDLSDDQKSQMLEEFQTKRPERTRVDEEPKAISLDKVNWTNEQKQTFRKICSVAMTTYGYSETESYYL